MSELEELLNRFIACFRHTEQLVPVRVLETISGNALDKMGGLPSKVLKITCRLLPIRIFHYLYPIFTSNISDRIQGK